MENSANTAVCSGRLRVDIIFDKKILVILLYKSTYFILSVGGSKYVSVIIVILFVTTAFCGTIEPNGFQWDYDVDIEQHKTAVAKKKCIYV